jgi:hypothetical protein
MCSIANRAILKMTTTEEPLMELHDSMMDSVGNLKWFKRKFRLIVESQQASRFMMGERMYQERDTGDSKIIQALQYYMNQERVYIH